MLNQNFALNIKISTVNRAKIKILESIAYYLMYLHVHSVTKLSTITR